MKMIGCDACTAPGYLGEDVICSDALEISFRHDVIYSNRMNIMMIFARVHKLPSAFEASHMGTAI